MKWFLKCLRNYANFKGRARCKEYWMFVLFSLICTYAVWLLGILLTGDCGVFDRFMTLYADHPFVDDPFRVNTLIVYHWYYLAIGLILLLPGLAVTVRRLHDTGRSGWMLGWFWLIYAIMIAVIFGAIVLFRGYTGILVWLLYGFSLYLRGFVFIIAFIVWLCQPGIRGSNRYGPDPLAVEE